MVLSTLTRFDLDISRDYNITSNKGPHINDHLHPISMSLRVAAATSHHRLLLELGGRKRYGEGVELLDDVKMI